ncbi:hypothetical protein [Streptosporangium sp. NPDC051022]|uniref:hypothetical protein n=1 Tax=Streptosporangium sp. NPDC051022 TaxID=3155752 RepID=UPI0034162D43
MDFWGTITVLFRRWYVVVPAFLLSLAAAVGVYSTVPTTYVSSAVLVLTTPTTGGSLPSDPSRPNGLTNPLLNFDRGLSISASILIAVMSTPDMGTELGVAEGGDTTFKISNGGNNLESLATGPYVFIEGESLSPDAAQDIVKRVIARTRIELANRQEAVKAPKATYITSYEAVPPTVPLAQRGRKMRAVAAALGVGIATAICAAFIAESFTQSRRARREARKRADTKRTAEPPPGTAALNGRAPADSSAAR